MNAKKTAVTALTIATLLIAGGLMATQVVRADDTDPRSNFIQKLAERFGLNQNDVEAFFNEQNQERRQEIKLRHEEHMAELVANGTITEAQKQALESKHEEMITKREALIALPSEQRRLEEQKLHNELKTWAETQGIDITLIRPRMGMHHGHGIGI